MKEGNGGFVSAAVMEKPVLLRCIYPRIGLISDTRLRGTVRADYSFVAKNGAFGGRQSVRRQAPRFSEPIQARLKFDITTIITHFLAARKRK